MRSLLFSALLLLPVAAVAGSPGKGAEKAKPCFECHGQDGNQSITDDIPKIGGQYESFLLHALKSYKNGERNNAVMSGQLASFSDRDLADLAAYFAAQKSEVEDLHGKL